GVQARSWHRPAEVDVDDADAVSGPFGLVGGETDGPGRRVAEEHLRHRTVVGGNGVRTPRGGVDGPPGGAGGDRGGGDAGLVLALVGEQGVPVDVAESVQPALLEGGDPAGVVDLQPGPAKQADGVQADVVGERLPAGGEQHLVGLHLAAFSVIVPPSGVATATRRWPSSRPWPRISSVYPTGPAPIT